MQSSIDAEGFRSLREGEVVEFFVETGEDGRMKAVKVTGPDGAPPQARTFALHSIPLYIFLYSPHLASSRLGQ